MKYFIDTEFHEYKRKPLIGKSFDTIELISIGIISEDRFGIFNEQRVYQAINKDFDFSKVWSNVWLRDNVLLQIVFSNSPSFISDYGDYGNFLHEFQRNKFMKIKYGTFYFQCLNLIKRIGKPIKQIAEEIVIYTQFEFQRYEPRLSSKEEVQYAIENNQYGPKFYGYFCDYDWVALCWIFGRMIDLPYGFPMYCHDLKQTLDTIINNRIQNGDTETYNFNIELEKIKNHHDYPQNVDEHSALGDAKWNYQLYEFIKSNFDTYI